MIVYRDIAAVKEGDELVMVDYGVRWFLRVTSKTLTTENWEVVGDPILAENDDRYVVRVGFDDWVPVLLLATKQPA